MFAANTILGPPGFRSKLTGCGKGNVISAHRRSLPQGNTVTRAAGPMQQPRRITTSGLAQAKRRSGMMGVVFDHFSVARWRARSFSRGGDCRS
jgi:hypothetical protein